MPVVTAFRTSKTVSNAVIKALKGWRTRWQKVEFGWERGNSALMFFIALIVYA
jgi:hypothetical protein